MQNSRKSKRNKTVKQRDANSFLACKLKIAIGDSWRNLRLDCVVISLQYAYRLLAIDMVF